MSERAVHFIVASLTGILSGAYIFKPLIESNAIQGRSPAKKNDEPCHEQENSSAVLESMSKK